MSVATRALLAALGFLAVGLLVGATYSTESSGGYDCGTVFSPNDAELFDSLNNFADAYSGGDGQSGAAVGCADAMGGPEMVTYGSLVAGGVLLLVVWLMPMRGRTTKEQGGRPPPEE